MKVLLRAVMVIEFYQQRSTGKRKHYRKCRVTKREYNIILQDLLTSSVSFILLVTYKELLNLLSIRGD